jgi:hypothetical protein
MKKYVWLMIVLGLVGATWYYIANSEKSASTVIGENLSTPDRIAEINGYVLSISGNEITVANEMGAKEISDEERARRQKLTQEERQALKAQESANLTKENVTLTIPVGVTIVKGSGDASGTNLKAMMSEIVKGGYISIWKNGSEVEFVKLKGTSTQ